MKNGPAPASEAKSPCISDIIIEASEPMDQPSLCLWPHQEGQLMEPSAQEMLTDADLGLLKRNFLWLELPQVTNLALCW